MCLSISKISNASIFSPSSSVSGEDLAPARRALDAVRGLGAALFGALLFKVGATAEAELEVVFVLAAALFARVHVGPPNRIATARRIRAAVALAQVWSCQSGEGVA